MRIQAIVSVMFHLASYDVSKLDRMPSEQLLERVLRHVVGARQHRLR